MIIVVQTVGLLMESIFAQLALEGAAPLSENIFWTRDHREALAKILENREKEERTIVISSNIFHATLEHPEDDFMCGTLFANAVKELDPGAWFFIFSTMPSEKTKNIDGYIPKGRSSGEKEFLEFLRVDFRQVQTFEDLYVLLPWIKSV